MNHLKFTLEIIEISDNDDDDNDDDEELFLYYG